MFTIRFPFFFPFLSDVALPNSSGFMCFLEHRILRRFLVCMVFAPSHIFKCSKKIHTLFSKRKERKKKKNTEKKVWFLAPFR